MRGSRSKSREAALKILYQLDVTKDSPDEGCLLYFRHHRVSVNSQPFVTSLVQGTAAHQAQIDPLLTQHATNWTLSRMSIVDRNVLRLAAFELLFSHTLQTDTSALPFKVRPIVRQPRQEVFQFGQFDLSLCLLSPSMA